MDLAIIPECYVDTNLIETLVPTKNGYNHQKGCGTVTKVMKEQFANSFALGIIDKDKRQVDYLREFDEVHSTDNLLLHKHKTKHHYIIQISPAIERFLLFEAEVLEVSLAAHQLPRDFELLKKTAKTTTSKDDLRFKGLFRALKRGGSEGLITLRNWIIYLKTNTYDSDIEELKVFEGDEGY